MRDEVPKGGFEQAILDEHRGDVHAPARGQHLAAQHVIVRKKIDERAETAHLLQHGPRDRHGGAEAVAVPHEARRDQN